MITTEQLEQTEALKNFESHSKFYPQGFVKIQPGGCVMPPCYEKYHHRIHNEFKLRDDDVWVASFPKSGTTWTQEMVWNIMNNVDLETAKSESLDNRVPFMEISGIIDPGVLKVLNENAQEKGEKADMSGVMPFDDSLDAVLNLTTEKPRVIKTHLPVELMPEGVLTNSKIIYVARNPRDVVLSWYNHWTVIEGYTGDFNGFFDAFLEDVGGYYSPYFSHNIGYWNIRNRDNMLFIFYEDMKKDLKSVIQKVADFVGKELTDSQIEILYDHLQFDNMKNNKAVNKEEEIQGLLKMTGIKSIGDGKFMNKGKSGGWRSKLTEDQITRMQAWEQDRQKNTDLKFQYE